MASSARFIEWFDSRMNPGSPAVCLARGVEEGRLTLKGALATGGFLAIAGLFAAMAAALATGRLPVYAAALVFLVGWARAGRTSQLPVIGPATAGLQRAATLALGMGAHAEIVYGQNPAPLAAAGLYLAFGALVETLEQSEGEGGRRFSLLACVAGVLAVFAGAAGFFVRTRPALFVALAGGVLLMVRALPALRTLVPGAVRRFAEAARLSGLFLAAALVWGRWPTQGTVLALGAVPLALVIPCFALLASEEAVPLTESLRRREII